MRQPGRFFFCAIDKYEILHAIDSEGLGKFTGHRPHAHNRDRTIWLIGYKVTNGGRGEADNGHSLRAQFRIPANFPPSGTATRELSGMGTPDILGGYGTYSFYTDKVQVMNATGSGVTYPVKVKRNVVRATLYGPPHPFLIESKKLYASFVVYLDPKEPVVKLELGAEERRARGRAVSPRRRRGHP